MLKTLFFISLFAASIANVAQQSFDLKSSIARGKSIYEVNCQSCHMAEGEGLPGIYPPLTNSGNVANTTKSVQAILNGISIPTEVQGITYTTPMPAIQLKDQEVADVLNYIRNSFGNKYEAILPQDIQPALHAK